MRCYRQDYNTGMLTEYGELTDGENRKGITEIKHIMGLYRLWDTLLSRFPNLVIDNCASGGRRIDIETLSRSIAFFRSDYQCEFNSHAEKGVKEGATLSISDRDTGATFQSGSTVTIPLPQKRSCLIWEYEEQ